MYTYKNKLSGLKKDSFHEHVQCQSMQIPVSYQDDKENADSQIDRWVDSFFALYSRLTFVINCVVKALIWPDILGGS